MKKDSSIQETLKIQGFSNIEIEQSLNYLETLEYDLTKTKFIGEIIAKNERLAKYYFFRERLNIKIDSSDIKIGTRSDRQILQIENTNNNIKEAYVDIQGLRSKIDSFNWPLNFIDFDTL